MLIVKPIRTDESVPWKEINIAHVTARREDSEKHIFYHSNKKTKIEGWDYSFLDGRHWTKAKTLNCILRHHDVRLSWENLQQKLAFFVEKAGLFCFVLFFWRGTALKSSCQPYIDFQLWDYCGNMMCCDFCSYTFNTLFSAMFPFFSLHPKIDRCKEAGCWSHTVPDLKMRLLLAILSSSYTSSRAVPYWLSVHSSCPWLCLL